MEHSRKAFYIIVPCMILVTVFSVYILYRNFRPSPGLPYEQITMEEAAEYMEYETGYVLLDVQTEEEYQSGHIPGAWNLPLEVLAVQAPAVLRDVQQMIYVCARTAKRSKKAAQLLCDLGYTNITEIGSIADWPGETEQTGPETVHTEKAPAELRDAEAAE